MDGPLLRPGRDRSLPLHALTALALGTLLLADAVTATVARGHPAAWLALAAIPAGLVLLRRPVALGIALALAGTWLRILEVGVAPGCDQLAVSRAAFDVIAAGGNPWGIAYAVSVPPGAPYPYGPLAAVAAVGDVPLETAAMAGILLLLARERAVVTLAILACWVGWIRLGTCGINDQLPAFLLLAGLLLVERRTRGAVTAGVALVAAGTAVKPYLAAWAPGIAGFAGAWALLPFGLVAAACWLPALAWGPASFLASVEKARAIHPIPETSLNLPALRILAIPLALLGFRARSFGTMVVAGAAVFFAVLFLDRWASFGYLYVLLPPIGIVAERAWWGRSAARAGRSPAAIGEGGRR